jgi:hypothetical protein
MCHFKFNLRRYTTEAVEAVEVVEKGMGAGTAAAETAAAATAAVMRQVRPPPMGDVPHLQEQVSVMGFPSVGGCTSCNSADPYRQLESAGRVSTLETYKVISPGLA